MVQDFRYSVIVVVVVVVVVVIVIVAHLPVVVPKFFWLQFVGFHAFDVSILLIPWRLFVSANSNQRINRQLQQ